MNRTHMLLGGLLAVQVVLLLVLNLGALTGAQASSAPRALLPVLESITPAKVAINDGDETLVIERQGDGWVLPEAGNYPVQGDKVDDLIADLEAIEVRRPIVTSGKYHAALKVDDGDFESRVQVWEEAAGDPGVDLLIGTAPNYRITHVRSAETDDVFEAVGFSSSDIRSDPGSWIEKKLIDVSYEELSAVTVKNASGSFSLAKQDGSWVVTEPASRVGTELDQTAVDSFIRGLISVWLVDPVGPVDEAAHGLAEPAVRVALTRTLPAPAPEAPVVDESVAAEGGDSEGADSAAATPPAPELQTETTEYRIGGVKDDESGQRFVARAGFDYTVTVSKYDAEKALEKTIDDLVPTVAEDEEGTSSTDS